MRLPRLYAPGEVQLAQVRFMPDLAGLWPDPESGRLLELIAGWLGEQVKAQRLSLHAWAASPQRLLLLASVQERNSLSRAIQAIGRRLAAELRTGRVFEGRFKSALIEPAWVLTAQVWLESCPLFDGYASDPVTWRWSSAASHAGTVQTAGQQPVHLSDHESYWACGNTPFDRQAVYRTRLMQGLSAAERSPVEAALIGQWALGSETYVAELAKMASRRVVPGRRGRPSNKANSGKNDDPSLLKYTNIN